MAKDELIKNVFSRLADFSEIFSGYSKTRNKKAFINGFLIKLIDIKGMDDEQEKALVECLIAFIESLVALFVTFRQCFVKK